MMSENIVELLNNSLSGKLVQTESASKPVDVLYK